MLNHREYTHWIDQQYCIDIHADEMARKGLSDSIVNRMDAIVLYRENFRLEKCFMHFKVADIPAEWLVNEYRAIRKHVETTVPDPYDTAWGEYLWERIQYHAKRLGIED